MTAGLFSKSGLFMGENLHKPGPENAKGYFEDSGINNLNNRILARYTPQPIVIDGISYLTDTPSKSRGGGWLSRISSNTDIVASVQEREEIRAFTNRAPFCFKDPRFSYLHDLWADGLDDTRSICVFRKPNIVVESILNNCRRSSPLHNFSISVNQAYDVWRLMYRRILERHCRRGKWLFVEYESLFERRTLEALQDFCDISIDFDFPDIELNRSESELAIPSNIENLYQRLRAHASM